MMISKQWKILYKIVYLQLDFFVYHLTKSSSISKLLDHQLYDDLLYSYLDPNSVSTYNILHPVIIDSQIVDFSIVSTISRWIAKTDIKNDNYRESYSPYKFESLLSI